MANLIPLAEVVVLPDRQRTSFDLDAIQELAISIRDNSLLHPIVIDDAGLIAGERRFEAVKLLNEMGENFHHNGLVVPMGLIPYTHLGDLTLVQRYEIELEENIRRQDLTWQERAKAEARLVQLKTELALSETGIPPTMTELAREIKTEGQTHALRSTLDLVKNLDRPEIAGAKTRADAIKTLKRVVLAEQHAKLAETVGQTYASAQHQLYHADCQVWMAEQAPDQFDVILTDPPYGMNADEFGDSGGKAHAHAYKDGPEVVEALLEWFPQAAYRLAKPAAHLYLFCDQEWFREWRAALAAAGWRVFRTPILWINPSKFRAPWPEHGPQRKWEMCIYAVKGNRPVTRLYPDTATYAADENLGHSAQKPVSLYTDLLQRSILPGDSVFDPFAGTGPIFEAAHSLKCKAVGVERDSVFYGIAAKRLQELQHENPAPDLG